MPVPAHCPQSLPDPTKEASVPTHTCRASKVSSRRGRGCRMSCAPNPCQIISFPLVGLCSAWHVSPGHAKGKGTPNSISTCETRHSPSLTGLAAVGEAWYASWAATALCWTSCIVTKKMAQTSGEGEHSPEMVLPTNSSHTVRAFTPISSTKS